MPSASKQRGSSNFTQQDGVSLKEYFDARFDAMDKALELAQRTNDVRLEGMNEFRNAMKDQTGHFVTRTEADLKINNIAAELKAEQAAVCADIELLQKSQNIAEGKASQSSVIIVFVISAIGMGVSICGLALGALEFIRMLPTN